MPSLALAYAPDKGGTEEQMTRINAAYAQMRANQESGWPPPEGNLPSP